MTTAAGFSGGRATQLALLADLGHGVATTLHRGTSRAMLVACLALAALAALATSAFASDVTAYVTNFYDGTVTPIATATNTPGSPITVGSYPAAIAITPDGKTACIGNYVHGAVTPVDLAT